MDGGRRLREKARFEHLLRNGVRRTAEGYTFYIGRQEAGGPRLGLLVTRRHAARATVRNGIKRCIREAFRLEQESLGHVDILVRPPYGVKPGSAMIARLRTLFTRLAA